MIVMHQRLVVVLICVLLQMPLVAAAQHLRLPEPLAILTPAAADKLALGRMLFFDRRLSGDGTISCAVCHIPDTAFADGLAISTAYPTNKHWRHTGSLLNVAYLDRFFWDGRSASLEDQAEEVIRSPFEMNMNPHYLVAKLAEIPAYRQVFEKAWRGEITLERVVASLAAFERSLLMTDSPFDRYLHGEQKTLSAQAEHGLEIFFGPRGNCVACHSESLLSDQDFHDLGLAEPSELVSDPQHRTTRHYFLGQQGVAMLDYDPGRYAVTHRLAEMRAFRTPPLRQVKETGPYMHNGSLKSLAEVIEFFNQGGGSGSNKSAKLKKLNLTTKEKQDLEAFLGSLSGTYPIIRAVPLPD